MKQNNYTMAMIILQLSLFHKKKFEIFDEILKLLFKKEKFNRFFKGSIPKKKNGRKRLRTKLFF